MGDETFDLSMAIVEGGAEHWYTVNFVKMELCNNDKNYTRRIRLVAGAMAKVMKAIGGGPEKTWPKVEKPKSS